MWTTYLIDGTKILTKEKPSQLVLEGQGVNTYNRHLRIFTNKQQATLTPLTTRAGVPDHELQENIITTGQLYSFWFCLFNLNKVRRQMAIIEDNKIYYKNKLKDFTDRQNWVLKIEEI